MRRSRRLREAPRLRAVAAYGVDPEDWRDWAGGVPDEVLAKVAGEVVAQTEAGWAAQLEEWGYSEAWIQRKVAERKRNGNCLFVFARVCKEWRKAQRKVGGPLRTRVQSDVVIPGSVALAKWALAEGCPRDNRYGVTMAHVAAQFGHMELVRWLIEEQGFASKVETRQNVRVSMGKKVMEEAARGGNLELVRWLRGKGCDWSARTCRYAARAGRTGVLQWLRANGCPWSAETCNEAAKNGHLATLRWARENGCQCDAGACYHAAHGGHLAILQWLRAEGCPWDFNTCYQAADEGHVEVLRWAREKGCVWDAETRDRAAAELGYTDDLGNLFPF